MTSPLHELAAHGRQMAIDTENRQESAPMWCTVSQHEIDRNIAAENTLLKMEQVLLGVANGTDPYPDDGEALDDAVIRNILQTLTSELGEDRIDPTVLRAIATIVSASQRARTTLLNQRFEEMIED